MALERPVFRKPDDPSRVQIALASFMAATMVYSLATRHGRGVPDDESDPVVMDAIEVAEAEECTYHTRPVMQAYWSAPPIDAFALKMRHHKHWGDRSPAPRDPLKSMDGKVD